MTAPTLALRDLVCFDAEACGLDGAIIAVGAVRVGLASRGMKVAATHFGGYWPDHPPVNDWTAAHVLPHLGGLARYPAAADLRRAFWAWLAAHGGDALVVVDCGWRVDARLLHDCLADGLDPDAAPYPLHDVASLMLAAGVDPLRARRDYVADLVPRELGACHDPVADAWVSAMCAARALGWI